MRIVHDALAALIMLSASSFNAALNAALAADGRLVVADPFAPTAGWALESDDAFVLTRAGCLEALARVDFDGNLVPVLAESWQQISPTEWDVTIRGGVRFQNGEALTAAAVAEALSHVLGADAPARAFSPKVVASVVATGDMTVRITTPKPSVLLPHRLAAPNTGILAPAAYSGEQVDPVGTCTGPFRIVEHHPRQAVRLERNADYWGGTCGCRRRSSGSSPPIGFLTADYACDGGYNLSKSCDPAVDAALEEARNVDDPAARNAMYAKIAAQLQDEAVTAFLVHVQHNEAASERVEGYRVHPLGHQVLVPELALSERRRHRYPP